MKFEEEDNNDWFEETEVPAEKPKEPRKPTLTPDDPAYWEQPESEFEHLKPSPDRRLWWWLAATGVVIGLLIAAYIQVFVPYVKTATQYGYVESVEKRGTVFNTYEGVILPYKSLMDTVRPYEGDIHFSTTNTDAAVMLRRMQYANRPVRINYKVYRTRMPWRGDERLYIVEVDSVDPRQILPPDRTPEIHR